MQKGCPIQLQARGKRRASCRWTSSREVDSSLHCVWGRSFMVRRFSTMCALALALLNLFGTDFWCRPPLTRRCAPTRHRQWRAPQISVPSAARGGAPLARATSSLAPSQAGELAGKSAAERDRTHLARAKWGPSTSRTPRQAAVVVSAPFAVAAAKLAAALSTSQARQPSVDGLRLAEHEREPEKQAEAAI